MKAAIYARVSTGEQNADNQVRELREFGARCGYEIASEYIDIESGATDDRPALRRMLRDATLGQFQRLLFWSLDRLSRAGVLKTLQLLQRITATGVKFRSLAQPELDTSGPLGEAITALFAALAQIERQQLIERTRAGLARARAQGKDLGRPRLLVNLNEVQMYKRQGKTQGQVAQQLGVSVSTLRRRFHFKSTNPSVNARKASAAPSTASEVAMPASSEGGTSADAIAWPT